MFVFITYDTWGLVTTPFSFLRYFETIIAFILGLVFMFAFGGVITYSADALTEFRAVNNLKDVPPDQLFLRKIRRASFHAAWVIFLFGDKLNIFYSLWVSFFLFCLWLFLLHIDDR